jgi:tetratricopeptide (TPR) repeat protein
LSSTFDNLGNVAPRVGQPAKALEYYTQSLDIRKKLAAADSSDARVQRDLSISYSKLGDVTLQVMGDTAKAIDYYTQGLDIRKKLAAADPSDALPQRDLSIFYNKLGDVNLQVMGDTAKAIDYYTQGLDIRKKLAAADPSNAQAQRDLCASYENLGVLEQGQKNHEQALQWLQLCLDLAEKLDKEGRLAPPNKEGIGKIKARIADCKDALEGKGKGEKKE